MRFLSLLPTLLFAGPLCAATVTDLYETTQPVETSRDAAFVDALKVVVVRVSGQRDAAERLGSAVNESRKYVQRFGFQADGSLQVGFDNVAVDRLLSSANLPIWGRERPAVLVLLNVADADGSAHWVSSDSPAGERDAITRTARQRGVPLVWPVMDTQDRVRLGGADGSSPEGLLQLAARYGANAALLGHARREGNVWSVRWTLVSSDGSAEFAGTPEEGIHFAADTFARVFAASASSVGSVIVEISGIGDLNAYASTLNYLEGMTLVRAVALQQVSGDMMRFRITVRGDAATLRRAIGLGQRLVPLSSGADPAVADDRLAFRYQP